MAEADYYTLTQQTYVAYFGRPADPLGLAAFAAALSSANAPTDIRLLPQAYKSNVAIKALVDGFGLSTESQQLYGAGATDVFVNAVFQNVLGRDAKLAGLLYWTAEIDSGRVTKGEAALKIMAGAFLNTSDPLQAAIDQTVVNNKIDVAGNFTTALNLPEEVAAYKGSAAAVLARMTLNAVTKDSKVSDFGPIIDSVITQMVNMKTPAGPAAAASELAFALHGPHTSAFDAGGPDWFSFDGDTYVADASPAAGQDGAAPVAIELVGTAAAGAPAIFA